MVKFSKELEAQLIPEWKDAFVNYWQLKKQIKKIKFTRLSKPTESVKSDISRSIFDSVRFLATKITDKFRASDDQPDIIKVRRKTTKDDDEEVYETELAQLFSEEDEVRVFFARLDEELNKVNQFYKLQEREFIERGEMLNRQLQILLQLKQILSDRRRQNSPARSYNLGIFPHSPAPDSDYSEMELVGAAIY